MFWMCELDKFVVIVVDGGINEASLEESVERGADDGWSAIAADFCERHSDLRVARGLEGGQHGVVDLLVVLCRRQRLGILRPFGRIGCSGRGRLARFVVLGL